MGYAHINNLYKDQRILLFKECYAAEKIHGTSAHVSFNLAWSPVGDTRELRFHSGGESQVNFEALFDKEALNEKFHALGHQNVTVYGEAYGGKQQGMSATYGKELKFIAFDVKITDTWLSLPDAKDVCDKVGIEFVPFEKIPATVEDIEHAMLLPSEVAGRRGCGFDKVREGVVCRPLIEVTLNNSERVMCKHKNEKFSERTSKKDTMPQAKLEVLQDAEKIALEWVTDIRLTHVLDKVCAAKSNGGLEGLGPEDTSTVVNAMIEDVYREAGAEIVQSRPAAKAIGNRAAKMYIARLKGAVR